MKLVTLLLLLPQFAVGAPPHAISAASDFEAGSIGKIEYVTETHLRCPVIGQSDQDRRNRQPSWFYFRLDGVADRDLTIDLTGLAGEYNYRPHNGRGMRNMRPVYSTDNNNWHHVGSAEWIETESTIRFRLKPTADRVWIARQPPYTTADLSRLLDGLRAHPHLKEATVGKTVEGRPMRLLTITNPATPEADKKILWLMARQHAWESGTSWVAEGTLRFLLSDDPEAARIRERYIFKVFPMADPDGVFHGGVRFNRNGYDLNRNWDTLDARLMPEIYCQHRAVMDWLDGGHRIDIFVTMHNTESEDFIEGRSQDRALGERFWKLLTQRTSFYQPKLLQPAADSTTPGMKGRMTVYQGLFHERKISAFLMEQMVDASPRLKRPPTVADRLEFGAKLVQVMGAAVTE